MKKFSFSLERVREWREKQLSIEQGRLEAMLAERSGIQLRRTALEKEVEETRRLIAHAPAVAGPEFQAVDSFLRYAVIERNRIRAALAKCERRVSEQQLRVTEARRRLELLEKLRSRKWTAWSAELAREIEAQAGEAYLAKWGR